MKQKFNNSNYRTKVDRFPNMKNLLQNTIDGIIDKPTNRDFWDKIAKGWREYEHEKSNEKWISRNLKSWIEESREYGKTSIETEENQKPSRTNTKTDPSAPSAGRRESPVHHAQDPSVQEDPVCQTQGKRAKKRP